MQKTGKLCLALAGLCIMLSWGCATRTPVSSDSMPKHPAYQAGDLFTPQPHAAPTLITHEGFLKKTDQVKYVLLGEGHTVACDHVVQAKLIQDLHNAGLSPVIGLEMVGENLQPVFDRFNANLTLPNTQRESSTQVLKKLRKELDWDRSWGYPFSLYEPIFQLAYAQKIPFYALNMPPRVVRAFRGKQAKDLPENQRKYLPPKIILPTQEQQDYLKKEFKGHVEMMQSLKKKKKKVAMAPGKAMDSFFRTQSLWDTKMAARALEVHGQTNRPVAIVVGSGHVENGWGIAYRLKQLDPTLTDENILLIMPWRGMERPKENIADVLFYCPETHTSRMGFTLEMRLDDPPRAHVIDVEPGSRAQKAGFKTGDGIIRAMNKPIKSLGDLHVAALKAKRAKKALTLTILRGTQRLELNIPLK